MDTDTYQASRLFPEIVSAYSALDTATVYEGNGQRGAMDHSIRPITSGQRVCGRALTVLCHPGDNLMLHAAVAVAERGDVIIADVGSLVDAGYWGEITTVAAMVRGVAGLVIGGGIRDAAAIARHGFPVWSSGVCMRATVKKTLGTMNQPVVVGGVTVHAGDLILGDDDGLVVVTAGNLMSTLDRARSRATQEISIMKQLSDGALTLDILGLRDALGADLQA